MQPFSSPAGPDKSGVGGGQAYWVRSRGLIGARVAQTSSRANDPQLHEHTPSPPTLVQGSGAEHWLK